MDANSQMFTLDSPHVQTSSSHHSEPQEAQCGVCRRAFTPGNGVADGFEAISICRECKHLVVDDYEATPLIRNIHRRRRQRGRGSRHGSSESIDDLFSQQFSQLIGLVRQNHEAPVDDGGDSTATVPSRGSYPSARNLARSWRRPFSDYDSESLDHGDSLFGETDSNISFYGADSEASPGVHSLLEREVSIQLDYESHNYTDTDIDPMHAGMDQWNSDDQDEDIGWEINTRGASSRLVGPHDQMQDTFDSPSGSINSAQNSRWIHWRARHADLFADLEELDVPPFVGNSNDYVDARGFEELLEQLAETGGSRRGAPPAAASIIGRLPRVIISKSHERNGSLICAVCKDPLPIDSEATQLPCSHLYHPSCILPWLSARNSCPVCRYELPTDDVEYEQGRRNTGGVEIHGIRGQDREEDSFSNVLTGEQAEGSERAAYNLNREGGGGGNSSGRGWFFLAAAPIVGIVGIALALWFRNSVGDVRVHCSRGEHGHQQPQRSRSSISDRSRRWWLPL